MKQENQYGRGSTQEDFSWGREERGVWQEVNKGQEDRDEMLSGMGS